MNRLKYLWNRYDIIDVYKLGLTVCPAAGYGCGMVINYNKEAYKQDRVIDKIQVAVMGGFMGFAGGMLLGVVWPFTWPFTCVPVALVGVDYIYGKLTTPHPSPSPSINKSCDDN